MLTSVETKKFSVKWIATSALLLAIYLGFFHACVALDVSNYVAIGAGCWLAWAAVCWMVRNVFYNRFEYVIHQVVGLDLLFEGFNPYHEGYGFYFCATGFWVVLWTYHWFAGKSCCGFGASAIAPVVSIEEPVRSG